MIGVLVVGIIIWCIHRYRTAMAQDDYDLLGGRLCEKFEVIVWQVNQVAFNGEGTITELDKKNFNLYKHPSNNIIQFTYHAGVLSVTWRHKFLQKEVVWQKSFSQVRNLSIIEQQRLANVIIEESSSVITLHQQRVLAGY